MSAPRPGAVALARAARAVLLLATLLAACAAPPPPGPSDAEKQAWAEAVGVLARDREAGAEALRAFVAAHPRSPLAADAHLRLAELALEARRPDEAREELARVLREHPEAPASDPARLLLARLERARGRPESAYRVARDVRLPLLDRRTRQRAHRLLADLAGEAGRPVARVGWLSRVRADQPDEEAAAAVDREIQATLARLDVDALARAAEELGRRVPAARVRIEESMRRLRRGDAEGARRAFEQAEALPLGPGDAERLAALETALEGGRPPGPLLPPPSPDGRVADVDPAAATGVLGVALPLSGPWASFGEEALQGALLAAGIFGDPEQTGRSGVVLRVRDTAGEPARAARAVRQLARDPDVAAVIGPLLADAASAAAAAAEREGLPVLSLTRSEEATRGRRLAMHLGASPRVQAERIAEYAVDGLGIRRFAILYPDDAYGRRLRALFWDAVERRGGRVVGVGRYPADATDFAGPIRRLVGYELLSGGERAALAERERLYKRAKRLPPEEAAQLRERARTTTAPDGSPLPPFVDFEAVFVPDAHENAALLAPHLAFHDVRGVRLLGLSGLHHPELIAIGGEHVEGAVFTADFHAGSEAPRVAAFVARYREAFGAEPGYLAAQAYDATQLAVRQLQEGRRTRGALAEGLRALGAWPGVTGVIAPGPDGGTLKRPPLLGVERGAFVPVDGDHGAPRLPPPPRRRQDAEGAGGVAG
ncbi:MAG: penicillin-binding protein activator [Myxococcota bacterium]|nr:penicillin-binding protein activator [Myxococcota bacterium]